MIYNIKTFKITAHFANSNYFHFRQPLSNYSFMYIPRDVFNFYLHSTVVATVITFRSTMEPLVRSSRLDGRSRQLEKQLMMA